ncbi:hypothetical protein COLO4_17569 [Corchorus olitorius]|uniref:Uncharacterized protein n=1 Tax=Corchorus olitorius TaxID=93759 RepID=A0A1R3JC93_9ROSI|nr:hypothetical protein COLO4_17569 [Corchorus olitorius]
MLPTFIGVWMFFAIMFYMNLEPLAQPTRTFRFFSAMFILFLGVFLLLLLHPLPILSPPYAPISTTVKGYAPITISTISDCFAFITLFLAVIGIVSLETLFPLEFPLTMVVIRYMLALSLVGDVGLLAFPLVRGFVIWFIVSISGSLFERDLYGLVGVV